MRTIASEKLMLGCTLLTIALAPWPFACVHPLFELYLSWGLMAIFTFWCVSLLMKDGLLKHAVHRAGWAWGCLVGLTLLVAVPLLPIPTAICQVLSPSVQHWSELTTPKVRESLTASTAGVGAGQPIPLPNTSLLSGPLSLSPGGNYQLVLRLVALCVLFLALASVERPTTSLRQLAWLATGVGSALALVSLLHSVSPPGSLLYGLFEKQGGYGPFVNKNLYPFFANLAIGLTLGLLFERWTRAGLGRFGPD